MFKSLLEDIDWLWQDWWIGQPDQLSEGDLRRGSSSLHLLLVQGLLGKAWRHYGFKGQPKVVGPDLSSIAAYNGLHLDCAVGCIAGGGRQRGADISFIGAFRVDNPTTGVSAKAKKGFAVEVGSIARLVTDSPTTSPLDEYIEKEWYLSDYLQSPGAVRKGQVITRQEVIKYFRNFVGGSHHDLATGKKNSNSEMSQLIANLEGHVKADTRDGLYFELLSIGQAVARSEDIRSLAEKIRHDL